MERKQHKTRGIPIQSADGAGGKRFAALPVVIGEGIGKRVIVVPVRRMNRHTGGLVENNEVAVLIDNRKR